jgi:hypothetical protein
MVECQIPGCIKEATTVWQKSNLCQDCWEKERASYVKILEEIKDLMD